MGKGIISSKQIYLRPIVESDIDKGWMEWMNDGEINKFLVNNNPTTREDLLNYLSNSKPPSAYMFAICMVSDDSYIGNARISSINWISRRASYGRLIGSKNSRGKGLGTEVLILLAYYAFYHLNLNRIQTGVVDTNIGSLRSNEKSGAVKEGIIREAEYINGVYHDSIMYSILKKDFDKRAYKDII